MRHHAKLQDQEPATGDKETPEEGETEEQPPTEDATMPSQDEKSDEEPEPSAAALS